MKLARAIVQASAAAGVLVVILACGRSPPTNPEEVKRVAKEELGLTEADICSDGEAAIRAKLESFVAQHCPGGETDIDPNGLPLQQRDACFAFTGPSRKGPFVPIGNAETLSQKDDIHCTDYKVVKEEDKKDEKPERTSVSQSYQFVARGRAGSLAGGHVHIWAQSTQTCWKHNHRCTEKPSKRKGKDPIILKLSNRYSVWGQVSGISVYDYKLSTFGKTVLDDKADLACNVYYPRPQGGKWHPKVTGDWVGADATSCGGAQ
jgi:hypothetical protein